MSYRATLLKFMLLSASLLAAGCGSKGSSGSSGASSGGSAGEDPGTGGDGTAGQNSAAGGNGAGGEHPSAGGDGTAGQNPATGGDGTAGQNPGTGGNGTAGQNPGTGGDGAGGEVAGTGGGAGRGGAGGDGGRSEGGAAGSGGTVSNPCDGVDCSSLDDACNEGICNIITGECAAVPLDDGTSCDDGDACTTADACVSGTCGGSEVDCAGLTDACNVGQCNATTGACEAVPVTDGTSCDDGDACTSNDVCGSGTCGGSAFDCSGLSDACNVGQCDSSGGCVVVPVTDGTSCDDGNACTTSDACVSGTCGGSAVDCSRLSDACNVGQCNARTGACEAVPANEGSRCDDGDACTRTDVCRSGTCGGSAVDCSGLTDACNVGQCNGTTGACQAVPVADGTSCDDGIVCTTGDACVAGACEATPVTMPNDSCASPELVSGADGQRTIVGSTTCATDSARGTCHQTGARDLTYSFELSAPRRVTLETVAPTGTGFDTTLYVRSTCDDAATQLECNDDSAGLYSLIDADYQAGTYYMFVDGYVGGLDGDFQLEMNVVEPDTCTGAATLEIPARGETSTFESSTTGATNTFTSTCGSSANSPDHVYQFTITETTRLVFETLAPAAERYDTVLHLRAGCEEGAGTTIACNDDGGAGTLSRLNVVLDPGTYSLIVDGFASSSSGTYVVQVSNEVGADLYALPYDFYQWDADAAALLDRAVSYGLGSSPTVGIVSECADTSGSTSSASPGGASAGEFNATIAALTYAGFPPSRIIPITNAADAVAQAGSYDVLLFPESELCTRDATAWVTPINDLILTGGRMVVTSGDNNQVTFLSALGLFGSGTGAGGSVAPYAAETTNEFWNGIVHPGSLNATRAWVWGGAGLEPLAYDNAGNLTVFGYNR